MAFAVKLSGRRRHHLFFVLLVIIVLQKLIGLSLMIAGVHVCVTLSFKLHPSDKILVENLFFGIAVYGLVLMFVHLVGIRLCYHCANPHMHPFCGYFLLLWFILSLLVSLLGVLIASLAPVCSKLLIEHLRNSLHRGMGQYLNDPEWKMSLDQLQQTYECCGTEHYSDWHRSAWLPADQFREDTQTVLRYIEMDGRILPPVVPWSCCNPMTRLLCLHDQLQQVRSRFVWQDQPHLVTETIHTIGCLYKLQRPIKAVLDGVIGISSVAFILQVVAVVVARYLYTSNRNSLLLGDPEGPAYGWLLGRGDCGFSKGKTMEELDMAKAAAAKHVAVEMKELNQPANTNVTLQKTISQTDSSFRIGKRKRKKKRKRPFRSSNIIDKEEGITTRIHLHASRD